MKSVFWWILSLKQQKGSCRFTKIHSLKRQPLFVCYGKIKMEKYCEGKLQYHRGRCLLWERSLFLLCLPGHFPWGFHDRRYVTFPHRCNYHRMPECVLLQSVLWFSSIISAPLHPMILQERWIRSRIDWMQSGFRAEIRENWMPCCIAERMTSCVFGETWCSEVKKVPSMSLKMASQVNGVFISVWVETPTSARTPLKKW